MKNEKLKSKNLRKLKNKNEKLWCRAPRDGLKKPGQSASDIRKQRFCKNCVAPQNRCKAADARQRVAALLGGMQDPITQQMPLCRQSFAALFSYGTARKRRGVACCRGACCTPRSVGAACMRPANLPPPPVPGVIDAIPGVCTAYMPPAKRRVYRAATRNFERPQAAVLCALRAAFGGCATRRACGRSTTIFHSSFFIFHFLHALARFHVEHRGGGFSCQAGARCAILKAAREKG